MFQFLTTSWLAYGGGQYTPEAKDATVAQQYAIANAAYARSGLSPWAASRSCWAGKGHVAGMPAAPAPVVTVAAGSGGTITVAPGDTLSSLAAAHSVPGGWSALYAANRGTVSDPDMIYAGQVLRLP